MNPASRRSFLSLAGAGAATAALATVATPAGASTAPTATPLPAGAEGSLVAHVKDVRKGVVTVMVAGRSVEITDHELVARLASAATATKA